MLSKSVNKSILLWLFILLPLLAVILFRKSFDLGLYGDDWQHLYYLWKEFFIYKTKSFFDIRSYLNPYWPNYFYLGIISHFWGYYPPAYFIVSFLCRLFANIALYFFSYELTKSKLAAFLTTLVFLVSVAGLQTTDWVFNMNTYAGLGLLAIASTLYLKIRKLNTFKSWYYLSFVITFVLALAIVPTRMHGAIPFIFLTEIFLTYVVEKQTIKLDKYLLTRMMIALAAFLILVYFKSFGEGSYTAGRFTDSYKLIQDLIQNGYSSWWLYFLATIGHLVLPDSINISGNSFRKILFIEAFLSSSFIFISSYVISKSRKAYLYLPIAFALFWSMFLLLMNKIDPHTSSDIYFSISLGGYFLFWAIWFYIIGRKKYPEMTSALIIAPIWIISLTIIYWLFTPYYVIETTGRYMTMGAAGMAIFVGALSSLLLKSSLYSTSDRVSINSRLIGSLSLGVPVVILSVFLITNLQTGQRYLNILHQTRNKALTERGWNKLVQEVPTLDPNGPSVFYFTTDNPQSLEGVFVFGFFMRAGVTYRIPNMDLTPLPVTNYKELLDFVKDGTPLQKIHGRLASPVPLSRVFAFDFKNGELINITQVTRQRILQDLTVNQ